MSQSCKEREQLEKELLLAAHYHQVLEEATKVAAPSELAETRKHEEQARAAWELAARALGEHRAGHGC